MKPRLDATEYDKVDEACATLLVLSGAFPVLSVESQVLRTAWMVLDAEREALRPLRIKQLVAA